MADVKTICFYLPQFHPVAVNDDAWGRGFTDWVNVARAAPLFPGHVQPKYPGALGFYDLRAPEVIEEQAELAALYGVYGFAYYYYRFGTETLLQSPVRNLLTRRRPDFPFCYCWANESWTRAWDGRTSEVLIEQTYDDATWRGLEADLDDAFRDERYIRVGGRPIFLIYQIDKVPKASASLASFRDRLRDRTGEDVLLGAVYMPRLSDAGAKLADFLVQFPPHRIPRSGERELLTAAEVGSYNPEREDFFEAYDAVVAAALSSVDAYDKLCPGVGPDWDNSPRRRREAHVLLGSTPEKFEQWVAEAARHALRKHRSGSIPAPFLFVNAWNEWAEGAMLEPSDHLGEAYLAALRRGIESAAVG